MREIEPKNAQIAPLHTLSPCARGPAAAPPWRGVAPPCGFAAVATAQNARNGTTPLPARFAHHAVPQGERAFAPPCERLSNTLRVLSSIVAAMLLLATPAFALDYVETPYFATAVASGKLPPVAQRLPEHPRIADLPVLGREPGKPGGTLRMLIGDQRNINSMTLNSYTRLVVFDEKLNLAPDILESYEIEQGRIFTLHLRKGHKWSDGHAFTTEDFRYYWEDVATNPRLSSNGPRQELLAKGKPPVVTILDATTIRYAWETPNPGFLPALAAAQPVYICLPAHYLKQFHEKYADKKVLDALLKTAKVKDWGSLHERKARQYRPENPDLPTLDPWRNTTPPPSEFFTFERNPYYHRAASDGRQLPYIDKVRLQIATTNLIPAKAGGGESDLQAQAVLFDNYTFLKEGEKNAGYTVRLWSRGEGAYASLVPNQNAADPVWRRLIQDARFRRALSAGIDREDINKVVFFGLAQESANTMIPESPMFHERHRDAWSIYNPGLANFLLDELGLDRRDYEGFRLLPDGRRVEFTVETSGENTNETDIIELVADDYRKLGIRVLAHSSQRDIFRRRIISGETLFSMWPGLDNGVATPDMEPTNLAPANITQFHWPQWGQFVDTGGRMGEPITNPSASRLAELLAAWRNSGGAEERAAIWSEMLDINANQVFIIGIVNRIPQPVIVSKRLRNVPEKAIYSFEPWAFFGGSRMDLFWFSDTKTAGN